jgi:hypothetical protein
MLNSSPQEKDMGGEGEFKYLTCLNPKKSSIYGDKMASDGVLYLSDCLILRRGIVLGQKLIGASEKEMNLMISNPSTSKRGFLP